MVAGYPIAALGGHRDAAKDISAADDDADFNAHGAGFGDIRGNPVSDGDIDPGTPWLPTSSASPEAFNSTRL